MNCLKSITGETQFQGIDRDDMDSEISQWIEMMITKKDCSAETAMKILNLTLTRLINESTGLEGIIYLYDDHSTHIATMMNLPYDILKIIPIYSDYKNSETGSKPRLAEKLIKRKLGEFKEDFEWWDPDDWAEAFEDWYDDLMDWFEELIEDFLELLSDLVAFVLDSIAAVADFIGNVVEAVVEAGLALVEAIVTAVMAVLDMMLKAVLLTLLYLLLSWTLLGIIMGNLVMIPLFLSVIISEGGSIEYDVMSLEIELAGLTILMSSVIEWNYNSYYDLDIPFVLRETYINDNLMFYQIENILAGDIEDNYLEIDDLSSTSGSDPIVLSAEEEYAYFENENLID